MWKWICLFLLFSSYLTGGTTLKERFTKAHVGDYIVTFQSNHYSMLIIRELTPTQLTLEEITIPSSALKSTKLSWKKWEVQSAPGHTARLKYVFDLGKNTLTQCYSYTQKQWLFIDQSDYLLTKLLSLSFQPTQESERKRIGPSPLPGDPDRRKSWSPALIRNGEKMRCSRFEVLKAKWPNDQTRMANCDIELYLDADQPSFPFPYWIELQGPHYTFKIQTIDSGILN